MSRKHSFTLTFEHATEIEEAIKHARDASLKRQAIAMRMLHLGYSLEQIEDVLLVSTKTLHSWISHWNKVGHLGSVLHVKVTRRKTPDSDQESQQLRAAIQAIVDTGIVKTPRFAQKEKSRLVRLRAERLDQG